MNILSWLKLDFGQIADLFNDLVHDHFWLSVALVLTLLVILFIYLGAMAASALAVLKRLLPYATRWWAAVPALGVVFGLFILSYSTVAHLRGTGLPTPSLPAPAPVLGEDQILRWDVPADVAATGLKYEVQSSATPDFSAPETKIVGESMFLLRAGKNETRYWRVRAVDAGHKDRGRRRFGAWSKPAKVAQYINVLEKIRLSRRFIVAMENEFDRSVFRWYGGPADQTNTAGREVTYEGFEMDIAYAIADEICGQHIEGQKDPASGRDMTCEPSRPSARAGLNQDRCKDKVCVHIDMGVAAQGFEEVMQSVGQGQADMAISSITYKPERERKYNILFGTESYEVTGFGLVARADAGTSAVAPSASLPFEGMKVAVQGGTTSFDCMSWLRDALSEAGKPSFEVVPLGRNVMGLHALARGTAGYRYVVMDYAFADGWRNLEGEGRVEVSALQTVFEANRNAKMPALCLGQHYRVAVRAGEDGLQQLADRVIARLSKSGALADLKKQAGERYSEYVRAARTGDAVSPGSTGSLKKP